MLPAGPPTRPEDRVQLNYAKPSRRGPRKVVWAALIVFLSVLGALGRRPFIAWQQQRALTTLMQRCLQGGANGDVVLTTKLNDAGALRARNVEVETFRYDESDPPRNVAVHRDWQSLRDKLIECGALRFSETPEHVVNLYVGPPPNSVRPDELLAIDLHFFARSSPIPHSIVYTHVTRATEAANWKVSTYGYGYWFRPFSEARELQIFRGSASRAPGKIAVDCTLDSDFHTLFFEGTYPSISPIQPTFDYEDWKVRRGLDRN